MHYTIPANMTLPDIVLGILILKPGNPHFKEGIFEQGLRHAAEHHPRLRALFRTYRDVISDRYNSLDRVLASLQSGGFYITASTDLQHLSITDACKEIGRESLEEEYDKKAFQRLRPLAEAVWNYAGQNQ